MENEVLEYIKQEAMKDYTFDVTKKLLEEDIPIEKVSYYSGLTEEEVLSISNAK